MLTLLCAGLAAPSQAAPGPAAPGGGDNAPIDIQANEQEFAGDMIIARGNVKVTYKDSIVTAPMAQMFRGPDGQPQKAIFTGHPHLLQGRNRMDADKLIFEIITGNVIADGHSHSEVASQDDGSAKAPDADAAAEDTAVDTTKKAVKKEVKPTHATTPEMMVTDADHQEYAKEGGKFLATGHVKVKTGDILVKSDKLNLVYGLDNKPETAVFTGHVDATQFDNNTQADLMTYFLTTQRLQATGNVRSKVIQRKDDPKKGGLSDQSKAANAPLDPATLGDLPDDEVITIISDAQDYSKDTGRIAAQGNVKVKYGEITGFGPHVVVSRNDEGQAEKVVFTGRSQINQPGKRWIGDRITFTVQDKKVLAEGNTRAIILQKPAGGAKPGGTVSGSMMAAAPAPKAVAEKPAAQPPKAIARRVRDTEEVETPQ